MEAQTAIQYPITYDDFIGQPATHRAGFAAFIPSASGKLKVSVVAGYYSYSAPRADLDNPAGYTAMEVAIIKPEGPWASYNELEAAGAFAIVGKGEYEYMDEDKRDEDGVCVFGYVPVESIINLINSI